MGRSLADGIDFIRYSRAYIILLFAGAPSKVIITRSEWCLPFFGEEDEHISPMFQIASISTVRPASPCNTDSTQHYFTVYLSNRFASFESVRSEKH